MYKISSTPKPWISPFIKDDADSVTLCASSPLGLTLEDKERLMKAFPPDNASVDFFIHSRNMKDKKHKDADLKREFQPLAALTQEADDHLKPYLDPIARHIINQIKQAAPDYTSDDYFEDARWQVIGRRYHTGTSGKTAIVGQHQDGKRDATQPHATFSTVIEVSRHKDLKGANLILRTHQPPSVQTISYKPFYANTIHNPTCTHEVTQGFIPSSTNWYDEEDSDGEEPVRARDILIVFLYLPHYPRGDDPWPETFISSRV